MVEYINAYDLDNPNKIIPMDRNIFYDEQIASFKETWKLTKTIDIIQLLLFNEKGELILQKRAKDKRHNPNMIDKSIWGHVNVWDLPNHTVMIETVQELEVPSFVLQTHQEFMRNYDILDIYLKSMALIKYIDTRVLYMKRVFDKEVIPVVSNTNFYLWVYNWKVNNIDWEAQWIIYYDIDTLQEEMEQFPDMFTDDLHVLFREFWKDIENFVKIIKTK